MEQVIELTKSLERNGGTLSPPQHHFNVGCLLSLGKYENAAFANSYHEHPSSVDGLINIFTS